jgi:hypothetical protein
MAVITNIPEWFAIGIKFRSQYINQGSNICTLLSFNKISNLAEVHVETGDTNFIEADWNLQHIIWGFEQREYLLVEKPIKAAIKQYQYDCLHNRGYVTNTRGPSKCVICGKPLF